MHMGSGITSYTHGLLVNLKIHFADATAKTSSRNNTSWMDHSPGMEPFPLSTWWWSPKTASIQHGCHKMHSVLGSLIAFIDGRQENLEGHYAFK